MIRYLIKNNFKIMTRSAANILLFIISPVIVSAVLISAFSSLLESYKGVDNFDVGYRVTEESQYTQYLDDMINVAQDNGINFERYDDGEPEKLINENELGGFIIFNSDGYTVYESQDLKAEGSTLEYMMSTMFNSVLSGDSEGIKLNIEKPDFMPAINATDYYGIIYIVYFGWCAIVCASGLIINEKKHKIRDRLRVSNLSVLQMYLARLIPMVTAVSFGIGIAAIIGVVFMGVHWGNAALSALVVLVMLIAASAFEMMIYEVCGSTVGTIIISFVVVWVMGYIGGSFETYIFSSHPESLKMLIPIYHENRALVELSCMGHSDFVVSSIAYGLAITVVSIIISVIAGNIRRIDR